MKIEIIDGNIIKKKNVKEVVKHLKLQDASLPKNIEEYMETIKSRMELINKKIKTDSISEFLLSLEESGLIKIKEGREEITEN